ncbi:MAG TPA: BrnT family toxin [Bradyrhizobium sp.]|nr:BrnT family toxin [Bradyrhizobium sp.]
MAITFDPVKRDHTLAERGLDFADAQQVFAGPLVENPDDRFDYGEERFITVGYLNGRMVVVVWTSRGEDRHIISMRKANDRERRKYQEQLGGPGRCS